MHEITNRSPLTQVFRIKHGQDGSKAVSLAPGATQTLDLADRNGPDVKAKEDAGLIDIKTKRAPAPSSPAAKAD